MPLCRGQRPTSSTSGEKLRKGADKDDDGEYRHAGEGGFSGDGSDDVAGHQQLQAEQDRPAGLLAERR